MKNIDLENYDYKKCKTLSAQLFFSIAHNSTLKVDDIYEPSLKVVTTNGDAKKAKKEILAILSKEFNISFQSDLYQNYITHESCHKVFTGKNNFDLDESELENLTYKCQNPWLKNYLALIKLLDEYTRNVLRNDFPMFPKYWDFGLSKY